MEFTHPTTRILSSFTREHAASSADLVDGFSSSILQITFRCLPHSHNSITLDSSLYLLMNIRSPKCMVRTIRSSVKDMLLEARKILKTDQRLPFWRKNVLPSPEDSPLHSLSALCAKRSRPKGSKFLEKSSESKYKDRLSSLV